MTKISPPMRFSPNANSPTTWSKNATPTITSPSKPIMPHSLTTSLFGSETDKTPTLSLMTRPTTAASKPVKSGRPPPLQLLELSSCRPSLCHRTHRDQQKDRPILPRDRLWHHQPLPSTSQRPTPARDQPWPLVHRNQLPLYPRLEL